MKPRFPIVNDTILAYATPIRHRHYTGLDPFNRTLAAQILALRERSPAGKAHSNVGGWHSDSELLSTLGEPLGGQLSRMFLDNVRAAFDVMVEVPDALPAAVNIEAWANINSRGDSNVSHIHGGCPWSGVYYVASDDGTGAGGNLVFTDPRTAALMVVHPFNPFKGANRITISPQPGLMVVFPSFLYHGVEPYQGQSARISIAFNMLSPK